MSTCKHDHSAPDATLRNLHDSQAGPERHKCCECAFDAGHQRGIKGTAISGGAVECVHSGLSAPKEVIDGLPASQAGPGRHKCAVCAYDAGFQLGKAMSPS